MSMKQFRNAAELVDLLQTRGMHIPDADEAIRHLSRTSYYRLSGYWYPMRQWDSNARVRLDHFRSGASFDLVIKLYKFDERLRHAIFTELEPIELALRAFLGHELGALDPLIYEKRDRLGPGANKRLKRNKKTVYDEWKDRFNSNRKSSERREDFVKHHKDKYGGKLPIWVAVEIMDWGTLSYLFSMAPDEVRENIARTCDLKPVQLESWIISLNHVRNYAAHHGRMYNRTYGNKPKFSQDPALKAVEAVKNRLFGQLSMVQFLHRKLGLSEAARLPTVLKTYPHNRLVPFERTGAPKDWEALELWKS